MGKLAVRQAIEYGVSKVAIQKVFGGPAVTQIINTAIPPGNIGYKNADMYPDSNGQGNAAKCKSMLKQAGYPNGLTLNGLYPNDSVNTQVFVALQASLKSCGITLKGKGEPGSSYFVDLGNSPENDKAGTWDLGRRQLVSGLVRPQRPDDHLAAVPDQLRRQYEQLRLQQQPAAQRADRQGRGGDLADRGGQLLGPRRTRT